MTELNSLEFGEVLSRFERWRTIAAALGQKPYDKPDFEGSRLYFRSGYAEQVAKWPAARERGDWGAYVIEQTPTGLFNVIRSLWHERAPKRTETIEAVFSQAEDAGKYVIANVGLSIRGSLRPRIKLPLLYVIWENRNLRPAIITVTPPADIVQELISSMSDANPEMIRKYLEMYVLHDTPEVYAMTFPSSSPYMHVLALSFDQLDAELAEGLPLGIRTETDSPPD